MNVKWHCIFDMFTEGILIFSQHIICLFCISFEALSMMKVFISLILVAFHCNLLLERMTCVSCNEKQLELGKWKAIRISKMTDDTSQNQW